METDINIFNKKKEDAINIFSAQKEIYNPYFGQKIILNSDGFHHLQFSSRKERTKSEQLLKFNLLPQALEIIRRSGTIQEYRNPVLVAIGKKSSKGEVAMKNVEYWGMIAIIGKFKVRTVLRRVGNGNITFWSVMPYSKIKNGQQKKMFGEGIEDE
ncbi:MAG: hypothetical protein NTW35_03415 [Candidatus Nomurabacteria bacterium]|nr:hypothetical protein [Candidatus Nomurabacteria bacterium]